MAERRAKVIWTEQEEDKLFPALAQVYKSDPKASAKKAADLAQMVLPPHRHRNIQSPLHFPARLRARMVAAGMIRLEGAPAGEVDKNLLRINQLADEVEVKSKRIAALEEDTAGLVSEMKELRRQLAQVPTEAQVLKTFVADIFWDLEQRKRALPGPTSADVNKAVLQPAVPVRRHNSEPTSEGRTRKPQIVIFYNENEKNPDWQKDFPDFDLRLEPVREDGRVHVPLGAVDVLLVHGIRHATSATVREKYPGAKMVMRFDVDKMLRSITERMKVRAA